MTVIPVGFGQITHVFAGGAVPLGAVITYGIEMTALDPLLACQEAAAQYSTHIRPHVNNSVTVVQTRLKMGPVEDGPTFEVNHNAEGALGGEPEPPQVAYLCKKQTAMGGRKNRGRFYLPGVETSKVGPNGHVDPTFHTALGNALASFLEDLEAGGAQMHILHGDATAPTPVTNLALDSIVATQRRRLR